MGVAVTSSSCTYLAAERQWRFLANGKGEPIDKVCETVDASSEFGSGGILVSTYQEMRMEKRQYADTIGL